MSSLEIAASVTVFATTGFVLARALAYSLDINNTGLRRTHVSVSVAIVSAFVGLLIGLIATWS